LPVRACVSGCGHVDTRWLGAAQAMEIKSAAKAEKMAAADAEKAKKEAAEWMEGADVRRLKRCVHWTGVVACVPDPQQFRCRAVLPCLSTPPPNP
jgi:hypothetical protein